MSHEQAEIRAGSRDRARADARREIRRRGAEEGVTTTRITEAEASLDGAFLAAGLVECLFGGR